MTQSGSGGWSPTGRHQVPGSDPAPYEQPQQQYEQQYQYPPQYGQTVQQVIVQHGASNGLGVAGFVTGLLGLIFCWVPGLGIVLAVLGIILGGVGIASGRKSGAGIGLAVAGLVLGIIALIPAILIISAVSTVSGS